MSSEAAQAIQIDENPKVAIAASLHLGDSLVYLILANNLVRNGFDVVFYSSFVAQLSAWLPHINCRPFPPLTEFEKELGHFDVVISDIKNPLIYKRDPDVVANLPKKYIFLGLPKVKRELIADHSLRLKNLSEFKAEKLKTIASCSGDIRVENDLNLSMVEHLASFCKYKLNLSDVTADIGFKVPSELTFQKHKKRVLLHPTSTDVKKDWPASRFLKLARRLRKQGYKVEFTVAPNEREEWLHITNGEFSVPVTKTIADLAAYLYESRALISSDSGTGHLASVLGIPVLTIYRKRRSTFTWRPGWFDCQVISPPFTMKLFGKRVWKPFLSVDRVYKAFSKLVE